MSTTITNKFIARIACLAFVCLLLPAQPAGAAPADTTKHSSLDVSLGLGWGYYFNDMYNVPGSEIHNNKPAFSVRAMWVPRYRLQIGVQSGYYPMFSSDAVISGQTGRLEKTYGYRAVVPFFVLASMRLVDHFYLSAGAGPAFLHYTIETDGERSDGSQWSGANFLISAEYKYPITDKLRLGVMAEYTRFGKTEDDHMTIQATIAYRLFSW